ncbi:MAG: type II toxin-antitoxin system HicB family antitoxin [Bacillota bacterium]|nr:type II toxin-antitoxin system HicB family antitoxin [Bacillota bacterium]
MSKIKYPAVFHKENGDFWVEFPDLAGCLSQGDSVEEAYENAKEALGLFLDQNEDTYCRKINKPRSFLEICAIFPNEIVLLVEYDSLEYAKKYKTRAIKKTLSIPEWLNDLAIKENVNFSNVLQEALIEKLVK